MRTLLHLIEGYEACPPEVVFAEKLEASLRTGSGLDNDVVEHATCRRNRNVVFFIDGGKISEASHHAAAGQLSVLL